MSPQRIQLKRTKGWRKPEGAIVVSRPNAWGNPFEVGAEGVGWVGDAYAVGHYGEKLWWHDLGVPGGLTAGQAVALFRYELEACLEDDPDDADHQAQVLELRAAVEALRGHDLACWCPLDQPCHADVLLEIANGGTS